MSGVRPRWQETLELARAGVTLGEIRRRLNYPSLVHVQEELAEVLIHSTGLDTLDVDVLLEWDRLDRLRVAVWPKAMKGDVAAVEQALRIGDRQRQIRSELARTGSRSGSGVSTGPRGGRR